MKFRFENFFDRVQKGIDRAARKQLGRFGGYVRRVDKNSLKYATKNRTKSRPGMPPVVHRGERFSRAKVNRKTRVATRQKVSPLRELTFYAYEPARKSVVIGPAVFRASRIGGGRAPKVIEEGGAARFFSRGRQRAGVFRARPHLGPAFKAAQSKIAELFRGSVTR